MNNFNAQDYSDYDATGVSEFFASMDEVEEKMQSVYNQNIFIEVLYAAAPNPTEYAILIARELPENIFGELPDNDLLSNSKTLTFDVIDMFNYEPEEIERAFEQLYEKVHLLQKAHRQLN